ncbi:hypothetical protein RQP46_006280 [Phenoliferia psychrophenolica]
MIDDANKPVNNPAGAPIVMGLFIFDGAKTNGENLYQVAGHVIRLQSGCAKDPAARLQGLQVDWTAAWWNYLRVCVSYPLSPVLLTMRD